MVPLLVRKLSLMEVKFAREKAKSDLPPIINKRNGS
jgi:hypothetical protein